MLHWSIYLQVYLRVLMSSDFIQVWPYRPECVLGRHLSCLIFCYLASKNPSIGFTMSFAYDAEGNHPHQRHMSVSHYASNIGNLNSHDARRRSSVVYVGSVSAAAGQRNGVLNQKDETLRKMSIAVPNLAELTSDAKNAAERERNMGFIEGCKLYPKAMFFSFALSLAVIMVGSSILYSCVLESRCPFICTFEHVSG